MTKVTKTQLLSPEATKKFNEAMNHLSEHEAFLGFTTGMMLALLIIILF